MTANLAIYSQIDTIATWRAVPVRYCMRIARGVARLMMRICLAFVMVAGGGVLAPVLASEKGAAAELNSSAVNKP